MNMVSDDLSLLAFFLRVFEAIDTQDVFAMVLRAVVFGFTIGFAGTYVGYYSSRGTEGVGKAANLAVVSSMFLVFVEELLIVQLLSLLK